GLSSTVSASRTAAKSSPIDVFSLIDQTDTLTVNGRTYTSVFSASVRTFTNTTPSGRQSTTMIDALGRPMQTQLAGLNAVGFSYGSRGRVQSTSQGNGPETRTNTFGYNSLGFLETVMDPLGRITSFQYDNAGRVTQQTLPGNRIISFSYDV